MHNYSDNGNMLSVLENLLPPSAEEVTHKLADDFRKRRVEKNLTREDIASMSGVAMSNIVRFERTGLISLTNMAKLAIALGYAHEMENILATPKYSTMEELLQIRKNGGRQKAHKHPKK